MPRITIDHREIEVPAGTTILEAARHLGIAIPTLCYRRDCRPETSCMVCVVKIEGSERLLPACATRCTEGMVVESETAEVRAARRVALELLLADHRGDCVGPCQYICPAGLDIPRMVGLIRCGDMRAAVAVTHDTIAFPSVLGRVCAAFCEKGCRRAGRDASIAIRLLKRAVGDYDLACREPLAPPCAPETGRRVAVVGGGPAGLTAAYYLRRAGHEVTVLESASQAGGGLRTGVAPEALPPSVLQGEIAGVARLGVRLVTDAMVGRDVSLADLQREYDAVVLACGEVTEDAARSLGLALHGKGLAHDRHTLMTERLGVFVAGSALAPSRHAVRAVGSGRLVAQAVCQHLAGEHIHVDHRPYTVLMGELSPAEMAVFSASASPVDRAIPAGGEATGLGADEARAEAARCLQCTCEGIDTCRLRHWGHAYEANPHRVKIARRPYGLDQSHPDVIYEPGKCIACGLCVQIASRTPGLGLTFVDRGFRVRMAAPLASDLEQALGAAARECARACPTAALRWRGNAVDTAEHGEGG